MKAKVFIATTYDEYHLEAKVFPTMDKATAYIAQDFIKNDWEWQEWLSDSERKLETLTDLQVLSYWDEHATADRWYNINADYIETDELTEKE